jgi:hypothetical protein
MSIYINDGVLVDPSWVNSLAISNDGVTWSTINKHGVDVSYTIVNAPVGSQAPMNNKAQYAKITLRRAMSGEVLLTFDVDDVENHPLWNTATTGNLVTSVQNCMSDITGWLN